MLRVTGIGRNEYIALMNACKAKKLLWRVNKGIARDLLPAAPLDIAMEPWWGVQVVNVGECDYSETCGTSLSSPRYCLYSSMHVTCSMYCYAIHVFQELFQQRRSCCGKPASHAVLRTAALLHAFFVEAESWQALETRGLQNAQRAHL
jgi:hypothetical protein